jgi:phenylalanyl-tRNA synthetase beta chain
VAEINLTEIFKLSAAATRYTPLPRYPAVVRDVTLLVDRNLPFAELAAAIASEKVEALNDVKLVGTYEGQNIPDNKRSVTVRIEYRSEQGTLRDEDVEQRHRILLDGLLKKFHAELH